MNNKLETVWFADEFSDGIMQDVIKIVIDKFDSIKGFDGEDKTIILLHLFLKMAKKSLNTATYYTKTYVGKSDAKNFVIEFLDNCKQEMIADIDDN